MPEKPFLQRLRRAQEERRSWLCVGLDPVLEQMPEVVRRAGDPPATLGRGHAGGTPAPARARTTPTLVSRGPLVGKRCGRCCGGPVAR